MNLAPQLAQDMAEIETIFSSHSEYKGQKESFQNALQHFCNRFYSTFEWDRSGHEGSVVLKNWRTRDDVNAEDQRLKLEKKSLADKAAKDKAKARRLVHKNETNEEEKEKWISFAREKKEMADEMKDLENRAKKLKIDMQKREEEMTELAENLVNRFG